MSIVASTTLLGACPFMSLAAAPETFSETALDATGPKGPLKGTLLTPNSKPTAIVLVIPGSGPTDRSGNNPLGVNASPYRPLTGSLAAKGSVTLRVDERGMFANAMAVDDADAMTIADYVDGIRSWVDVFRRHIHTPCVWILGHSEGGLVTLTSVRKENMCGVALIATPGRPAGEMSRRQLNTNPENEILLEQALLIIDTPGHRRRVDITNIHPTLQSISNPTIQGFLINAFSYNPGHPVSSISKPVLVLQEQHDLRVKETDARLLKAVNPQASLVVLPNMNHVMKEVTSDDRKASIATCAESVLPLAPGLIDSIEHFLIRNSPFPER